MSPFKPRHKHLSGIFKSPQENSATKLSKINSFINCAVRVPTSSESLDTVTEFIYVFINLCIQLLSF